MNMLPGNKSIRKVPQQKRIGIGLKAVFEGGWLWRIWYSENGSRTEKWLVLPRAKSEAIIKKDQRGPNGEHFSVTKTVKEINRRFYWVRS